MKNKDIHLKKRKVLKISGVNSINFLNNILTSDISKLKPKETLPSALLSPQGRILFYMLVSFNNVDKSLNDKSVFVEYDIDHQNELIKKLNMYNLRREVTIEKTSYEVLVTTNYADYPHSLIDKRFFNEVLRRVYIADQSKIKNNDMNDDKNINWYDLLRYKNCILEGSKEIEANVSLPLETNLDLLGGISFDKGCFIGQEVNARIKWKGVVKRKYVPISIKSKKLSYLKLSNLNKKKIFLESKEIGEIICLLYNKDDGVWYGIAKIILSYLYSFELDKDLEGNFLDAKIKINFPKFMLPLPRKI